MTTPSRSASRRSLIRSRDLPGLLAYVLKTPIDRTLCRPARPRIISYAVTWRCNCRCRMCDNADLSPEMKRASEEMTADRVHAVFSDPLLQDLDVVRFTGGEPFCRNDLAETARALVTAAAPRVLYITTNGSEPEQISSLVTSLQGLGRRTRLHIQLSIDAIGDLHDRIRSRPGLFDRARDTMERLRDLRKCDAFSAGITQTILRENAYQVRAVQELAHSAGFAYKAVLAYRYHENNLVSGQHPPEPYPLTLRSPFTRNELSDLYREIAPPPPLPWALLGRSRTLTSGDLWGVGETWLHRGGRNRLLHNVARPSPRCVALFAYCRMLPNGDLVPCSLLAEPVGNLKERSFASVWRSQEASRARRRVLACPGCWVECDILPSLYYTPEFFRWLCITTWESLRQRTRAAAASLQPRRKRSGAGFGDLGRSEGPTASPDGSGA